MDWLTKCKEVTISARLMSAMGALYSTKKALADPNPSQISQMGWQTGQAVANAAKKLPIKPVFSFLLAAQFWRNRKIVIARTVEAPKAIRVIKKTFKKSSVGLNPNGFNRIMSVRTAYKNRITIVKATQPKKYFLAKSVSRIPCQSSEIILEIFISYSTLSFPLNMRMPQ